MVLLCVFLFLNCLYVFYEAHLLMLSNIETCDRLEDGEILDVKVFVNDFVNLVHNPGVFLYDDLLSIVSLRYQIVHILQIRDSGHLVDVRAIGAFCRDDDELFLHSSSQASSIVVCASIVV